MTTTEPTTAGRTLERSERAPFTHKLGYLPFGVFTADVVLDGTEFEYLFQGDVDDPEAVALGRIRRFDTNDYRATTANGCAVAEHTTRRNALRAIVRETIGWNE